MGFSVKLAPGVRVRASSPFSPARSATGSLAKPKCANGGDHGAHRFVSLLRVLKSSGDLDSSGVFNCRSKQA